MSELFYVELFRNERGMDRRLEFRGWVSDDAIELARRTDRLLLDDCEGEGRTAADWLLALECIVRRAIQRSERPIEGTVTDPATAAASQLATGEPKSQNTEI